jgi:flagellar hook-length control protein FliK
MQTGPADNLKQLTLFDAIPSAPPSSRDAARESAFAQHFAPPTTKRDDDARHKASSERPAARNEAEERSFAQDHDTEATRAKGQATDSHSAPPESSQRGEQTDRRAESAGEHDNHEGEARDGDNAQTGTATTADNVQPDQRETEEAADEVAAAPNNAPTMIVADGPPLECADSETPTEEQEGDADSARQAASEATKSGSFAAAPSARNGAVSSRKSTADNQTSTATDALESDAPNANTAETVDNSALLTEGEAEPAATDGEAHSPVSNKAMAVNSPGKSHDPSEATELPGVAGEVAAPRQESKHETRRDGKRERRPEQLSDAHGNTSPTPAAKPAAEATPPSTLTQPATVAAEALAAVTATSSELRTSDGAAARPAATASDGVATTSRLPQQLLAKNSASGSGGPPVTQAEQVRLVQRVARAFQAAQARGGEIQLRLSPPALGSLKLEVKVQNGVMTARVEAENATARHLLLDNLPLLKERLAEQGIQIDSFDVDLMDRQPQGESDTSRGGERDAAPRMPRTNGERRANEITTTAHNTPAAENSVRPGDGQINVTI